MNVTPKAERRKFGVFKKNDSLIFYTIYHLIVNFLLSQTTVKIKIHDGDHRQCLHKQYCRKDSHC